MGVPIQGKGINGWAGLFVYVDDEHNYVHTHVHLDPKTLDDSTLTHHYSGERDEEYFTLSLAMKKEGEHSEATVYLTRAQLAEVVATAQKALRRRKRFVYFCYRLFGRDA